MEYKSGDDGEIRGNARVSDGITFIESGGRLAAISDGAELWSRELSRIAEITSNHVISYNPVNEGRSRVDAFEKQTGEHSWTAPPRDVRSHLPKVAAFEDIVYVGTDKLAARDANTGNEYWQTTVEGYAEIETLSIIEESVSMNYATPVEGRVSKLALFSPEGEQLWSHSIDNVEGIYAANQYVFLIKDDRISALKPVDESYDRPLAFVGV